VLKRLFWFAAGIGFGFGVSLWARREVDALMSRFTPERVAAAFADAARDLASDLRGVLGGGRRLPGGARSGQQWGSGAGRRPGPPWDGSGRVSEPAGLAQPSRAAQPPYAARPDQVAQPGDIAQPGRRAAG
jgi:hypothetical protein